jgi:YVTN family beta-propeller protein
MIGRPLRQSWLLERYWNALRGARRTDPPAGLDPDLARLAEVLARESTQLEPTGAFLDDLRRQLRSQGMPGAARGWTAPALTPRPRPQPASDDAEEHTMARPTSAPHDEPIDLQQRLSREWLKIAAAAIVFGLVGALLALTLRGDDGSEPAIGPSGPTPTAAALASTATTAAVVPPTSVPSMATSTRGTTPATATVEPPPAQVQAVITVGRGPRAIVAGAGAIWVPDSPGGEILRIDPATNAVVARIEAHAVEAVMLDGSLWAINESAPDASLIRIDPAANTVVATFPVPGLALGSTRGLAAGAGSLWISDNRGQRVVRVDPQTGAVIATITVGHPTQIVATAEAVWAVDLAARTVIRIDPTTNTRVATIVVEEGPNSIALGAGSVWVTNQDSGSVSRIDPTTNRVVATIYLGPFHLGGAEESPFGIAIDEHGVWVTDWDHPRLYRIDPATNQVVATLKVSGAAGIVASDGSLWLTHHRSNAVTRVDPAP